jgi:hypothetical protein
MNTRIGIYSLKKQNPIRQIPNVSNEHIWNLQFLYCNLLKENFKAL